MQDESPGSRRKRAGFSVKQWALLVGVQVLVLLAVLSELRHPGCSSNVPSPVASPSASSAAARALLSHHARPALLATGCSDAAIVDDESSAAMAGDSGKPLRLSAASLLCKVADGSPAPSCADVAAAYVRATTVNAPVIFVVVKNVDTGTVVCQSEFAADGSNERTWRTRDGSTLR
jgi:hypothetical protein